MTVETTQAIVSRLSDWAKLFGIFAAIPLALLLAALAIFGVTKFADVNDKLKAAEQRAESLQTKSASVEEKYSQLQKDAERYEALGQKISAVAARYDALGQDVQSLKTDVTQIGKRVGFTPSSALTPSLQHRLERTVESYLSYLRARGFTPEAGQVQVSVVDQIEGDPASPAHWSPRANRMTVTRSYAQNDENGFLTTYTDILLKQKIGDNWDSEPSYSAVVICMGSYFPASFLGSRATEVAYSWPSVVTSSTVFNAGMALQKMLWDVRSDVGGTMTDAAIIKAWLETREAHMSTQYASIFAKKLIEALGNNGNKARSIFMAQGLPLD